MGGRTANPPVTTASDRYIDRLDAAAQVAAEGSGICPSAAVGASTSAAFGAQRAAAAGDAGS